MLKTFLALAVGAVIAGPALGADLSDADAQAFLQSLFPKSKWQKVCERPNGDRKVPELCLYPIKRKGLVGFVPWNSVKLRDLKEPATLVASELFLSKEPPPQPLRRARCRP